MLDASVAGYHEHFVGRASAAQRRYLSDDALLAHIKAVHAETHRGCGWPRTWRELLAQNWPAACSRTHASKLARDSGAVMGELSTMSAQLRSNGSRSG